MSNTPATVNALALIGDGYTLGITADAKLEKAVLLSTSSEVTVVSDPTTYEVAQDSTRSLAAMRNAVEKSRKQVKEPVLALGKQIDSIAAEFIADIEAEEKRIQSLMQDYAREQARIRAEQEAAARRAAAEAERQKQEAERKAREAEEQARRAEVLKTKAAQDKANAAAEEARRLSYEAAQKAQAEQTKALEQTLASVQTAAPAGVKEELDYEVTDIAALYRAAPQLVELSPRRKDILAALKQLQAANLPTTIPGLTIKKVLKISTR